MNLKDLCNCGLSRPKDQKLSKVTSMESDHDHQSSPSLSLALTLEPTSKADDEYSKSVLVTVHDHDHDQDDDESAGRMKKLRLDIYQSRILEDSFNVHTTLDLKQKQALARRLNLRPRQIEVWFQNRRARKKLKQTEIEYEMLRKRKETLKDENRRLQKEVQQLKEMKGKEMLPMPLIDMQRLLYSPSNLSICPFCERINSYGSPAI